LERSAPGADALLQLARELRRRRVRDAFVHLRRAWIALTRGNVALFELEGHRAWDLALQTNPLLEIAGEKLLADQRRGHALSAKNRLRDRKIVELAKNGVSAEGLVDRFRTQGVTSTRRIRQITSKKKTRRK
jgi:hypothetical protein